MTSEPQQHWIIVGAGSAGCVLANRLSEDGTRRITLLDDGPALVRGAVPDGIAGSSFFAAMAEPGRIHLDLLASRTAGAAPTLYQRGRGIGGSSAVNAMVALRGSLDVYTRWGWHDAEAAFDRIVLPTTRAMDHELGAIDRALMADPRTELARLTRLNGKRVTAAEAYLWPVVARSNLAVRANASVRSVRFDDQTATGVRLEDGEELSADRVILAAGAIHSPTILLRSSVATPGIGQGLQDHPAAVITLQLRDGIEQDLDGLPVASVLHASVDGNLLQVLPLSNLGPDPETAGLGAIMAALMTPVGRSGTITIDTDGLPVIDFDLLSDSRDVQSLTHAVRLALELIESGPFVDIVAASFIDDQGTTTDALDSDEAIGTWLRTNCADYVHATSTCAMGTVVDHLGAVIGYRNLFVSDASVFPTIPDANTHLPTTMLAERMAQRMLGTAIAG